MSESEEKPEENEVDLKAGGQRLSNDQMQLFATTENTIVEELPVKSNSAAARKAVQQIDLRDINEVFVLWRDTFYSAGKGHVKLTTKRHARIAAAIGAYGLDTCLMAIKGCSLSDWHMGNNPQGLRYTDITLIFRSHEHVERFVNLASHDGNEAARMFLEEQ